MATQIETAAVDQHHHIEFLGRSGSRIGGIWRWVTRWKIGGAGGSRIIEVFSETGGVR